MSWSRWGVLLPCLILSPWTAKAGYLDDIRFTQLRNELGAAMPTGAGIRVVQVESREDFPAQPTPLFRPSTVEPQFAGKAFNFISTPGGGSSHATEVGKFFYGNASSAAPGITNIDSYWADDWYDDGYLNTAGVPNVKPLLSQARIFNHSWVGDVAASALDLNALQRMDFVIEQYDVLQIVAMNNDETPAANDDVRGLWASSYNAISVGLTDGTHSYGTLGYTGFTGGSLYTAGRIKPDLVVPGVALPAPSKTSFSTPAVSATAALLLQTAHNNPGLSNNLSYTVPDGTASTRTVYYGETSEVIKAALMAGAQRGDVPGYSAVMPNGLDPKFGAGELDVYNSYKIIAGGRRASTETNGSQTILTQSGFDYDPVFSRTDTGSYYFNATPATTALTVTLAWNLDIAGGSFNFNGTATMYNFNLRLFEVTPQGNSLVASAASSNENTENIRFTSLVPGSQYLLQVSRGDSLSTNWDYGLAWLVTSQIILGDANGDGLVTAADYTIWRTNYGLFPGVATLAQGDFNGDRFINGGDYTVWADRFVLANAPSALGDLTNGPVVPEPGSWLLAGVGAVGLMGIAYRRRRAAG